MNNVKRLAKDAWNASFSMAYLSTDEKKRSLENIAESIWEKQEIILEANRKDVMIAKEMAEKGEITEVMLKRLSLNKAKIEEIVDMVRSIAELDDPIRKTNYAMELDKGLELYRVTSSIGVIGVIFESRPDALVQIASLCLKSGNSVLLKGGSEARYSNKTLYSIIKDAARSLPKGWIQILEAREEVKILLSLDEYVDLIIPRGSNEFVRYIQNNTRIPVLGHSDGVCHIYVDRDVDINLAVDVCFDSKVQYPAVCNAVDTLLIHSGIAESFLPQMIRKLRQSNVEIRVGPRALNFFNQGVQDATDSDWGKEYLDYIIAVKIVDSLDEAVNHINSYGSHHTDAILTMNEKEALRFMESVDSASVFWNTSTRFSDGYRYGLGAEVGISTGKIHARGPTGLEGLTSYKYYLKGNGQVVSDYVGLTPRKFKHRRINKKWKS
jgi:glutamate-5-semialdehyde dehydrogenase